VRPCYIFSSLPGSFSALFSCLPIHVRYMVFSEKAFIPNNSCGSWVVIFRSFWTGRILLFAFYEFSV
jgi:hypothetical protein